MRGAALRQQRSGNTGIGHADDALAHPGKALVERPVDKRLTGASRPIDRETLSSVRVGIDGARKYGIERCLLVSVHHAIVAVGFCRQFRVIDEIINLLLSEALRSPDPALAKFVAEFAPELDQVAVEANLFRLRRKGCPWVRPPVVRH